MIYAIYIDHNIVQFYFTIQFSIKFHLRNILLFLAEIQSHIRKLQENYPRFPQYMDFSSIYGLIQINYILFKNFKKFMYGTCSSIGILIFNILISGKPLSSIMQLCIMQLCNLKTNLIKTLHSVIKCISCHELKRTNYSVEQMCFLLKQLRFLKVYLMHFPRHDNRFKR